MVQDDDMVSTEKLVLTWAVIGGVGGSDQLVVPPANQGRIGSPFSTTRHVPRPPQLHRNVTCQTLRPASFGRDLRLCLSCLLSAGGSCGPILDSRRPSRTNAALALHSLAITRGSVCISPPSWLQRPAETVPQLPSATGHGPMLQWSGGIVDCGVNGIDLGCMTVAPTLLYISMHLARDRYLHQAFIALLGHASRAPDPHPSGHNIDADPCPACPETSHGR